MAFSAFLSGDLAGVDVDLSPHSSIKPWNSSQFSGSCGGASPSSPPPRPQTISGPTNGFLLHQTDFGFLNPCLKTNHYLLQYNGSASSPPSSAAGTVLNRPRIFPAGDHFQKDKQRAESPVSCESSITIEGMSRACRYSPEEKKQRIERYRSKRNKRNFNKKIKYACRKSLADSRPRIRGRFARYNDEEAVKNNYPMQWSDGREEEDEANGGDNWLKYFIDAYSSNLIP